MLPNITFQIFSWLFDIVLIIKIVSLPVTGRLLNVEQAVKWKL
jgi:hypothetical protein